jgi:hypothetical protein
VRLARGRHGGAFVRPRGKLATGGMLLPASETSAGAQPCATLASAVEASMARAHPAVRLKGG